MFIVLQFPLGTTEQEVNRLLHYLHKLKNLRPELYFFNLVDIEKSM